MNRKQKIIVSVTGIIIVTLALLGLTYAYFITQIQGNTNTKSIEVSTADLKLVYGDGNGTITATNITPGTIIDTKTFTVKNEGTITNRYAVYLENVINTFTNKDDIKITMTCTSSDGKTCSGISSSFPTYNDLILSNNIDVGVTQTYSVTIEYLETGVDQSIDMNKTISGKFQIYNMNDVVDLTGTITGASKGDYVELHSETKRSEIINNDYKIVGVNPGVHTLYVKDKDGNTLGTTTITVNKSSTENVEGNTFNVINTTRAINVDINTIQTDLSVTPAIQTAMLPTTISLSIIAYNDIEKIIFTNKIDYETADSIHSCVDIFDDDGNYLDCVASTEPNYENLSNNLLFPIYAWKKGNTLYIGVKKSAIYANFNSSHLFKNFNNLETIEFNNVLDTSRVTDMSYMFSDSDNLSSLDLSSFDTSSVTNMSYMFSDSDNLSSLDLSSFDTSSVTNMSYMFSDSNNLSSLDLSSFDTNSVTNMSYMFSNSYNITSLNLSNFDTSSVTDMSYMFSDCESLKTLNLSNFDTSSVTDMSYMFSYSNNLSSLDLSSFDTSKVTNMSYMFKGCRSLTTLNLSNFDTSSVTDMSSMFYFSDSLTNVYVKNNTEKEKIQTMSYIDNPSIIKIKS